jgi:uncharacterized membrane protein
MNRALLKPLDPATRFAWLPGTVRWTWFALFLADYVLVLGRLWRPWLFSGWAAWPEGLLLLLAAATTIASLTRELPLQNVLLAAVGIALVGAAMQSSSALTGLGFGPYPLPHGLGHDLRRSSPGRAALVWITVVLNCRGVARLMLRPRRRTSGYGLCLLGLTVVLVVFTESSLEPFATRLTHYWNWEASRSVVNRPPILWPAFAGWAAGALLVLLLAMPVLLNKKPVVVSPDFRPLAVWLLGNVLFLASAALRQIGPGVWLGLAQCGIVAALALRGGTAREAPNTAEPQAP